MPSPPTPHLYIRFPRQLCAGQAPRDGGCRVSWHYRPPPPPVLAGGNHGAWDSVNRRFLLNALGKVNRSPGRGQTPPSFQNWTVRPSLNHRIQLPQRKPGWPHRGHIKAKHTSSLGTFLLQVWDGTGCGRKGRDGPNPSLQVPDYLRAPGYTAPPPLHPHPSLWFQIRFWRQRVCSASCMNEEHMEKRASGTAGSLTSPERSVSHAPHRKPSMEKSIPGS